MLVDLIEKGFGKDRGYNCVQKVLFGTGEIYDLKLDEEMLIPLTNTLGGGLKTGNNCGALVGGVMALGKIFPDKEYQKEVVLYFIDSYKEKMGLINCKELKDKYSDSKLFGSSTHWKDAIAQIKLAHEPLS